MMSQHLICQTLYVSKFNAEFRNKPEKHTLLIHIQAYGRYALHNVCAVHQGVCSTPGDVQYTWGCSVHRRMFSTPGNIIEYTRGCSIHWGNIMSTSGDIMISVGGGHRETN